MGASLFLSTQLQAGVRALEFDAGAPMFLYAGTEAGTLAVFNVRSKNELFPCERKAA